MEEVQKDAAIATELSNHITNSQFPCVMAKAVEKIGGIKIYSHDQPLNADTVCDVHNAMCAFVDRFRESEKLASFLLVCDHPDYRSFEKFEDDFWRFLKSIRVHDQNFFPHDPRVSSDPNANDFSFSIKSEAFFILVLHPDSPRWSRRFTRPAIVFNPHVQFERLREKGMFARIRILIRARDKILQGSINPMLSDYGERSEVFQYVGRTYGPTDTVPLFH